MKASEFKWTKRKVVAAIGSACVAAMLSAVLSELSFWEKVSTKMDRMRQIIGWYEHFATPSEKRTDINIWNDEWVAAYPQEATAGKAIIARNKSLGLERWSGLHPFQQELLLGCPPISLWCLHYNRCYNVYFDKNRRGIIMGSHSTPLSEISPELQSLAHNFHLKESKYVSGIYGLDPAYYNERIETSVLPDDFE